MTHSRTMAYIQVLTFAVTLPFQGAMVGRALIQNNAASAAFSGFVVGTAVVAIVWRCLTMPPAGLAIPPAPSTPEPTANHPPTPPPAVAANLGGFGGGS